MTDKKLSVLCLVLLAVPLIFFAFQPATASESGEKVTIYFFWGDGCPHCARLKPYLEAWESEHDRVEIKKFEVWNDTSNRAIFKDMLEKHDIDREAVPVTFIGAEHWIGFRPRMVSQMKQAIQYCSQVDCPEPAAEVEAIQKDKSGGLEPIEVPFFGEIEVREQPLWLGTFFIAFVDGFNPCSLWVLTLLLALVIQTDSRSRVLVVGLTFLLVTATAYGGFVAGVFTAFDYIRNMFWIQVGVAVLAFLFGAVNVKDYFAYKKGMSLTIPERFQPRIYRNLRRLSNPRKSIPALVLTTAVMALGITLVELPCTAGFPVIWNGFLALHGVETAGFIALLVFYVIVYLSIELTIFLLAAFTLDATQLREKHGQVLKLVGGTVMLALAGVLVYDPNLMNDLSFTVYLFAGSIGAAFLLMGLRWMLPGGEGAGEQ